MENTNTTVLAQSARLMNNRTYLMIFLFFVGFVMRFTMISSIPLGLHLDEANSGYQAWSLLHYGIDSHGDKFPLPVFYGQGNGTYSLSAFAKMLPIQIFGPTVLGARFGGAFLACLTLVLFYFFCKKIAGDNFALLGLFLLAINPLHIVNARWDFLVCITIFFNFAASYFLFLGFEKRKYLILSAVFFGISLYAHPMLWVVSPFTIIFSVIYGVYCKKITFSKEALISVVILALFALPVGLWILIQFDIIPEIRTSFLTIPRLYQFSDGQTQIQMRFSSDGIIKHFFTFIRYMLYQGGDRLWVLEGFGMFYLFSALFVALGFFALVKDGIKKLKTREYYPPVFLLFTIFGSIFYILFSAGGGAWAPHISFLTLPLLFCCVYGVYLWWKKLGKTALILTIALYTFGFFSFTINYFTTTTGFNKRYEKVVQQAMASNYPTVYVIGIHYNNFLYASQYPTDQFVKDVKYFVHPDGWYLMAEKIGRFIFNFTELPLSADTAYVYPVQYTDMTKQLTDAGYVTEQTDDYIFAHAPVP
jgi:4-amino-4-deoxy-L-arabinose transferase-like glycosyltransferase